MKKLVVATLLLALAAAPAPAFADEERRFYAGAGVGQFNLEFDDGDFDLGGFDFDDDDTAFRLFGGWRFNRYFAVELAYVDLGAPSDRFDFGSLGSVDTEVEVTGFAPYAVATLPLGIFELYARLGYLFYDIEATVSDGFDSLSEDDSDEDLVYGVGAGLVLFERLNVRLEYEIVDVSDVENADAFWLTGAWRF